MRQFIVVFIFLLYSITLPAQVQEATLSVQLSDNLIEKLKSANGTQKVDILNKLSEGYKYVDVKKAKNYAENALEMAEDINYLKGVADAYQNFGGISFFIDAKYKQAMASFTKALKIYEKTNDKPEQAQTHQKVGLLYLEQNYIAKARVNFLEALEIFEEVGDSIGRVSVLCNLSLIYVLQKNYSLALNYLNKSLQISEKLRNKNELARVYNYFGVFYSAKKESEKAINLYNKALGMIGEDSRLKIEILNYQGQFYLTKKAYQQAEKSFNQALALAEKISTTNLIAKSLINLAELFRKTEKIEESINTLQKTLAITQTTDAKELEKIIFLALSELYQDQNNLPKSLEYYKIYAKLQDSLSTTQSLNLNIDMFAKDDVVRKLEKEKRKIVSTFDNINYYRERNKLLVYVLLIALILVIGLVAVLYNVIKERKKVNEKLEIKVKERTARIQLALQKLAKINSELDVFLYRTSHDLKGPVATLEGLINIAQAESDKKVVDSYLGHQKTIIGRMKLLLLRIIEIGFIRSHKLRYSPINLKQYCDRMIKSMRRIDGFKETIFTVDIPEYFFIKADIEMLDIAMDNIVRNAIQHSKSHARERDVRIWVEEYTDSWELFIADNGLGIPQDVAEKIFNLFFKNTDKSPGFGLGLYKARIAINKIDGEIKLVKSDKEETIFSIFIPKNPSTHLLLESAANQATEGL